MSISPLGDVVLVNQMTPVATIPQSAHTNRVELQNFMAQMAIQEKDEQILEVREAEESHALNPDREHTREEYDEEMQNMIQKRKSHKKEEPSSNSSVLHKLDIKV
ncbi:hypothetical protein MNB_SM-5-741 [hydrothermal vent metagenome]|uniref:Uncharacterized protein n=1 Tax=hydrothermal vent metagenome TaxID=652676 RepID=A0A1W1CVD1_9ZZZZ